MSHHQNLICHLREAIPWFCNTRRRSLATLFVLNKYINPILQPGTSHQGGWTYKLTTMSKSRPKLTRLGTTYILDPFWQPKLVAKYLGVKGGKIVSSQYGAGRHSSSFLPHFICALKSFRIHIYKRCCSTDTIMTCNLTYLGRHPFGLDFQHQNIKVNNVIKITFTSSNKLWKVSCSQHMYPIEMSK